MKQIIVVAMLVWMAGFAPAPAAEPKIKTVLVIGMDGVRTDALLAADTPHFDKLIDAGAFANNTQILSDHYRKSNTVSGPGWSSF